MAIINGSTRPSQAGGVTQRGPSLAASLSRAFDRLILALAVAAPLDDAAGLDLEYAEAMVEVFDEWLAVKGLRERHSHRSRP
jgi:hypothetical protein